MVGQLVGPYQVLSKLGEGGMGEVYRARDTKLNRDVAIKVLPDLFATDSERLARFTREAQTLAALNHPNIATIYGIEGSAIVMELVEGDDLSVRIAQGAMPVDEAMAVARQIIDALEAAHDSGIVHRDLKPANIKVRHDGTVKVLDFGLAKAMGPDGSNAPTDNSPTLTARATQMGMIIGTAAYMSPEQARGRAVDKRTDVWAFGCVLYEMLTGGKTFQGEDATEIISAVVKSEPDWNALPPAIPAHIRTIVARCLVKDRKARIPDLSVVRYMLDGTMPASGSAAPASPRALAWAWPAIAAVLVMTTLAAAWAWYDARAVVPTVVRFEVAPPAGTIFTAGGRVGHTVPVISPDGRWVAFTAEDPKQPGSRQLYVRPIDAVEATPLAGTGGASYPFWSPDSRHIGFSISGSLVKVSATGGPVQTLCALGPGIISRGGSWSDEGVIIFNNGPGPIHRVAAAGGEAVAIGQLTDGQDGRQFPAFLPDGRHFLFHAAGTPETTGVFVGSLDSDEITRVVSAETGAIFHAASGHLLFVRQGTLLAQTFNPDTFALSGEPFPVAEKVEASAVPGLVAFSVSGTGTLAYGIGLAADAGLQPTWVDRQGTVIGMVGPKANYRGIDLSPDGRHVAAHRHDGDGGDIWLTELARNSTSRFTMDPTQENSAPVWSPESDRIAFASIRNGKPGIYVKPARRTGAEELVFETPSGRLVPLSWTPDGNAILFNSLETGSGRDVWIVSLEGARAAAPLLESAAAESHGQVSPDGRWLAYGSSETGRSEVYVQTAAATGGKWPISITGGNAPRWRADSRELFYIGDGQVWAVAITHTGDELMAGVPQALFDHGGIHPHRDNYFSYAVSADGQRFLLTSRRQIGPDGESSAPIMVVFNWRAGL